MTDLAPRWTALAGSTPTAARIGDDLLRRWSEPHRHYHDQTHLQAVLDAVDVLVRDGAAVVDLSAVRYAAWFHDAVYDGIPGDDERASAALAEESLRSLHVPSPTIAEVVRLVHLTIDHNPAPDDLDGAALCDADLAVLGTDPATYADYARRVRLDYAHVPDDDFRAGRTAVLRNLLDLDPLFHTDAGHRRWGAQAHANLTSELGAV